MSSHEKWLRATAERLRIGNTNGAANVCDQAADEIAELTAENERLTTKNAELASSLKHASDEWSKCVGAISDLRADIASRQSWEVSIRAEVGPEPEEQYGYTNNFTDHYKQRAEHLAAKLVEANKIVDVVMSAAMKSVLPNSVVMALEAALKKPQPLVEKHCVWEFVTLSGNRPAAKPGCADYRHFYRDAATGNCPLCNMPVKLSGEQP